MTTALIICLVAYLLGSIPFGLILTRVAGLGDIRQIGSGNIGATNVLRTGKKSIAATVLLLDALKGTLAVYIAMFFQDAFAPFELPSQFVMAAALLALLGHIYPIWLKFKGGKGVATALGIWLALAPLVFVGIVITWLAAAFITRISSLGALVAMVALPALSYALAPAYLVASFLTAVLVIWRHRGNISRIIAGTEPKIGKKQADADR